MAAPENEDANPNIERPEVFTGTADFSQPMQGEVESVELKTQMGAWECVGWVLAMQLLIVFPALTWGAYSWAF